VFLLAVQMSMGSHSSMRALTMRLAADPTPLSCTLLSLEYVPVLETVKVTRIASVGGTAKKPVITEETIDQVLFDANPNQSQQTQLAGRLQVCSYTGSSFFIVG